MKKILGLLALTILTTHLQAITLNDALESGDYTKSGENLDVSYKGIDDVYYWEELKKKKFKGISVLKLTGNNLEDLPDDFIKYASRQHIIVYLDNNDFTQRDVDNLFKGWRKQHKMWLIFGLES